MSSTLPEKMYYKIGEVAEQIGVRTSVLRFWESEFHFLKPVKSNSGQRLYSKDEVDLIKQVRRLLYEEKFTIEGVKKRLSGRGKSRKPDDSAYAHSISPDQKELLSLVKDELLIIRKLL